MAKPKPKRIESSGCLVGGIAVHENEHVDLIPVPCVGEFSATLALRRLGERLQSGNLGPDGGAELVAELDARFEECLGYLARRLFGWTWTDMQGAPLPPPCDENHQPLGLRCLQADEISWLMSAGQQAGEGARNVGSA